MNVANFLDASARRLPHSPAIALETRTVLTYGELALRVARLSAGLRFRLGLKAGDRVALFMQNCVEYFEVLFAIWHAGLVAVPVNAKLHPRELQWILGDSGAKACFTLGDVENIDAIGVRSKAFDALHLEAGAPDERSVHIR